MFNFYGTTSTFAYSNKEVGVEIMKRESGME